MIQDLTDSRMDEALSQPKAVLKFWAPWCGPCRALAPVVEQVAEAHSDVPFYAINVDEQPQLAQRFQIRALPTIVGLNDGGVAFAQVGMIGKSGLEAKVQAMTKA